jgi:hypothetical protein
MVSFGRKSIDHGTSRFWAKITGVVLCGAICEVLEYKVNAKKPARIRIITTDQIIIVLFFILNFHNNL